MLLTGLEKDGGNGSVGVVDLTIEVDDECSVVVVNAPSRGSMRRVIQLLLRFFAGRPRIAAVGAERIGTVGPRYTAYYIDARPIKRRGYSE